MGHSASRRGDESSDSSSDEDSGYESSSAGSDSSFSSQDRGHSGGGCALWPCGRQKAKGAAAGLCLSSLVATPAFDFVNSSNIKAKSRSKLLVADNRQKALKDYFDIQNDSLGVGGFATVVVGTNKRTKARRAIKTLTKTKSDEDHVQREIDAMMRCDHPNIVKLFQTFEDDECVYFVLEVCEGKELFDRIVEEKSFSEPMAATVMQQIFRATAYIHKAGVCHRDIKPENFLFVSKEAPIEKNTIKMIDFGIARLFEPPKAYFKTKVGTPQYVAPEVLNQFFRYGVEVDVWSCGVVMYVLLAGSLPFNGRSDAEVLAKVKAAQFSMEGRKWLGVSEDAKNVIRQLLRKEPSKRLTAAQALQEKWVQNTAAKRPNAPILPMHLARLRQFTVQNKLKKVALALVARHMNSSEIDSLRDAFVQMDKNGDGLLSCAELREGLVQSGVPGIDDHQIEEIMRGVDADGSGEIDYTEFLAATLEHKSSLQEAVCRSAFRVFDKNDDGFISQEELKEALSQQDVKDVWGEGTVLALMQEVDTDGDGQIDFQEFMAMMRRQ